MLQRDVLGYLMSEALAERLLDNIDKTRDKDKQPLTVRELHRTLFDTIWSDEATPAGTESARRNLQREHVNRLATAVVGGASARADARAIMRQQAVKLLALLKKQHGGDPNSTAYAHRQACIDTLSSALQASVVRNAP